MGAKPIIFLPYSPNRSYLIITKQQHSKAPTPKAGPKKCATTNATAITPMNVNSFMVNNPPIYIR
jgi:hypothetical protein